MMTATPDDRWKCPDCSAWVRDDVDAHYCSAPTFITVPQPYLVPYYVQQPYQVWPYHQITCTTGNVCVDSSITISSNP